jgi:hypothetical protein
LRYRTDTSERISTICTCTTVVGLESMWIRLQAAPAPSESKPLAQRRLGDAPGRVRSRWPLPQWHCHHRRPPATTQQACAAPPPGQPGAARYLVRRVPAFARPGHARLRGVHAPVSCAWSPRQGLPRGSPQQSSPAPRARTALRASPIARRAKPATCAAGRLTARRARLGPTPTLAGTRTGPPSVLHASTGTTVPAPAIAWRAGMERRPARARPSATLARPVSSPSPVPARAATAPRGGWRTRAAPAAASAASPAPTAPRARPSAHSAPSARCALAAPAAQCAPSAAPPPGARAAARR